MMKKFDPTSDLAKAHSTILAHQSTLYNFIQDIRGAGDNDLLELEKSNQLNVIQRDDRQTYIFNVPNELVIKSLSKALNCNDFTLVERHYSVDKWYSKLQSNHNVFPFMHYTEAYYSKASQHYLIAHVYINQQGTIIGIHVKETNQSKQSLREIDVTDSLRNLLLDNYSYAYPVIELILNKRMERINDLIQKASTIENHLNNFSKTLWSANESHKDRSQIKNDYIKAAQNFLQIIEQLNRYNNQKDQRGMLIHLALSALNEATVQDKVEDKQDSPTQKSETESKKQTDYIPEPTKGLQNYSSLLSEIELLTSKLTPTLQYKKANIDAILEREEIIKQADLFILKTSMLSNYLTVIEVSKAIDNLMDLIINHKSCSYKLLEQSLQVGKPLEPLFMAYKDKLNINFYQQLFTKLLSTENKTEQDQIIATCTYLHLQDEKYRSIVYQLSNLMSFDLKSQYKASMSDELGDVAKSSGSLLFYAYICDKKDIFNLLLTHGANPNSWGIRNAELNGRSHTLIYCIATIKTQNYSDYIHLLIQNHATPNLIDTDKLWRMKSKLKTTINVLSMNKQYQKMQKTGKGKNVFTITATQSTPMLTNVAVDGNVVLTNKLIPYFTIDELAYVIATLSLQDDIGSILVFSGTFENPSLKAFSKQEIAINALNEFVAKQSIEYSSLPFAIQYLFPREANCKVLQSLLLCISYLILELEKRIATISPEDFLNAYKTLFERGLVNHSVNDLNSAQFAFEGCKILLSKYYPTLSTQEKRTLISEKLVVLYEKLIDTLATKASYFGPSEAKMDTMNSISMLKGCLAVAKDKHDPFWNKLRDQSSSDQKSNPSEEEQQARKNLQNWDFWKTEYNKKHPNREEHGYGPGAIVPYKFS